jgi:hypothetical protein
MLAKANVSRSKRKEGVIASAEAIEPTNATIIVNPIFIRLYPAAAQALAPSADDSAKFPRRALLRRYGKIDI